MAGKRSPAGPAREGFIIRLAEEKRRQRLAALLEELGDEIRELERLQARIALTMARLRLVLELENRS